MDSVKLDNVVVELVKPSLSEVVVGSETVSLLVVTYTIVVMIVLFARGVSIKLEAEKLPDVVVATSVVIVPVLEGSVSAVE